MSESMPTDNELIEKILQTARKESEEVVQEAATSVKQRQTALEQRVRQIEKDAAERVEKETAEIDKRADASVALAESRARLRRESRLLSIVETRTVAEIAGLRDTPDYAHVLRDWIVEAAAGLGVEHAEVICPDPDREIVRQVLDDAEKDLQKEHGLQVKLKVDSETAIDDQGVMLVSVPRRTAYSNTVADRMRRLRQGLRMIVYNIVIEGENERSDHR